MSDFRILNLDNYYEDLHFVTTIIDGVFRTERSTYNPFVKGVNQTTLPGFLEKDRIKVERLIDYIERVKVNLLKFQQRGVFDRWEDKEYLGLEKPFLCYPAKLWLDCKYEVDEGYGIGVYFLDTYYKDPNYRQLLFEYFPLKEGTELAF